MTTNTSAQDTRRHDCNQNTHKGWRFATVTLDSVAHRVGPGKDTHGTPVPEQGRPWPDATSTKTTTDKRQQDPTCWCLVVRQFPNILLGLGWEKVPNWGCLFVHRKQGLFLSVYVNDIKMVGKKQKMAPTRKQLMNDVDLDEPTSFLHHGHLGCTQRECKPNEIVINEYRNIF